MDRDNLWNKLGSWAYIIGIIIALLVGLIQAMTYEEAIVDITTYTGLSDFEDITTFNDVFFRTDTGASVAWILAILGLIVGFLVAMGKGTIAKNETQGFLVAGIACLVMGGVFPGLVTLYPLTPYIGSLLAGISVSLAIFVAPVVGILAIKVILDIGRD